MPKKSPERLEKSDIVRQLDADNVDSSMILIVTNEGERIYMHPFEDELAALEFLELMVNGFRNDLIEKALKRMVN
jgi:hypothetical protein